MNPYLRSMEAFWKDPEHVFVNESILGGVAVGLAYKEFKLPDWRAPVFPQADDKIFIAFLTVANSINYCFTDFDTGKQFDVEYPAGETQSGAFAMWASFMRALEDGEKILSPTYLSKLTLKRAEHIFRCIETPIPMMHDRVESLRDLGKRMRDVRGRGVDKFANIFEDADFYSYRDDGNGIMQKLVTFSCYRDSSIWKGIFLQFHKRAQLLPLMYHGRAMSSGGVLTPIRDPENFIPLADYRVPQALRGLGILEYSLELAQKVDEGKIIGKNSAMEIAIRAQTINVMEMLLEKINGHRLIASRNKNFLTPTEPITMAELDYEIWRLGRKTEGRHHYTYTTGY